MVPISRLILWCILKSLLYIARVMFYLEDTKFCLPLEEVMKCEKYHTE